MNFQPNILRASLPGPDSNGIVLVQGQFRHSTFYRRPWADGVFWPCRGSLVENFRARFFYPPGRFFVHLVRRLIAKGLLCFATGSASFFFHTLFFGLRLQA